MLDLRSRGEISDAEYAALRSTALGLRTGEPQPPPSAPSTRRAPPGPRDAGRQRPRPSWALPSLALGIATSLVVAWVSADYSAGQARGASPSVSFVYGLRATPFLVASAVLLLAGALGVVHARAATQPWLRWVAVAGVVAWLLVVLQGPMLVVP